MKKIFYLILIFVMATFYLPSISLADGCLFIPSYIEIYMNPIN